MTERKGPPDFVIEILSPKTRKLDLVKKKRVYARLGVKELWIIDLEPGTIAIHRFEQDSTESVSVLYPSDRIDTPLFLVFSMRVSAIFPAAANRLNSLHQR